MREVEREEEGTRPASQPGSKRGREALDAQGPRSQGSQQVGRELKEEQKKQIWQGGRGGRWS